MRRTTLIRCSASLGVLAFATTPAFAQTGSPGADNQAQTSPAQASAATQTASADDTAIVVTGIRRSLQSAQNIRRNSDQIINSVVAEDIGKLPDLNTAETAARIPGVQDLPPGRRGAERAGPRPAQFHHHL